MEMVQYKMFCLIFCENFRGSVVYFFYTLEIQFLNNHVDRSKDNHTKIPCIRFENKCKHGKKVLFLSNKCYQSQQKAPVKSYSEHGLIQDFL